MSNLKTFVLIAITSLLGACSNGKNLAHYEYEQPPLILEQYFSGPIKAWGIVQDRSGKVVRRFDVDMIGTWGKDTGTLEEDFAYYDGQTQKRIWTIKRMQTGAYQGTADDIIGKANGKTSGNAIRWAYEMELPVGDNSYKVKFDDWMFLMNDGVLINRSYIKKFGFTVAELTLFMQKQDQ